MAYVGILQDHRLLPTIGHWFEHHPEIEWHVGGFGKYESFFRDLSQRTDNVTFYGRLPYGEALQLEDACDLILAVYDPAIENHRLAAPNKFYESLMLGKPIIMAKGTGMSRIVEEEDLGVLIEYSESGFDAGMADLISRRDRWREIGARARSVYAERFDWRIMDQRLCALYDRLQADPPRRSRPRPAPTQIL